MRIGKVLALVIGGLVALFVCTLLGLWLLVNPNDYRDRIAVAVRNATGRELTLTGDLKLAVFPWIAIQVGPASLGNPPGFPDQPFLSFQRASVRVRLLPLLGKRLEAGRIEIVGLDVKLLKNVAGQGNWQGFGRSTAPASPARSGAGPAPGAGDDMGGLAGIAITDARVTYQDTVLEHIDFETGASAERGVVPLTLHLEAQRDGARVRLDARVDVGINTGPDRYALAALNLDGTLTRPGETHPLRWNVAAPQVDLDLAAQTLAAPQLNLDLAGAHLTTRLTGTRILDDPTLTGDLTLAPLVVREYLPRLGLTDFATRDPKALASMSASSQFAYGRNALEFTDLRLTLDDTHLTGTLAVSILRSPTVHFELNVDHIDLDHYLPPANAGSADTAPAPAPAVVSNLPLELNGTLTAGSITLSPLNLTRVNLTVATADRVLRIHPLTAEVDGGEYAGNISLDSRGATPLLSLDERLTGIDMGQLVAAQSTTPRLTGRGSMDLQATGHGAGSAAILRTLAGSFSARVEDGALEGVDLGYLIGRAASLLEREPGAVPQDTHRTRFDALKVTAKIANGVAVTHDLLISSSALKITGAGRVNLPTQGLDLALLVDTLKAVDGTPLQVPVKVAGTLADPVVLPDVEALAKGQLRQKVQDVLKDKLKALFK